MQEHLAVITAVDTEGMDTISALKKGFKAHFKHVLTIPEHYKTVMLSRDPLFLKRTAMMDPETVKRLPAQKHLIDTLEKGIRNKEIKALDPVLSAQIIWASLFGILLRIITENITDETLIDKMIDGYFTLLEQGITRS